MVQALWHIEALRNSVRGDFLDFAQSVGFLLVLTTTSGLAIYASFNWPWYVIMLPGIYQQPLLAFSG